MLILRCSSLIWDLNKYLIKVTHITQLKIIGMEQMIYRHSWPRGDDGREIGDAAACPMSRS